MTLNQRLKIARKDSGKTQALLAEELGVGIGTIKRFEKDASKIPVSMVSKIALLCGVDEIWLFTGTGKRIDETASSKERESSNLDIIRHQDLVKRFKNPEKGLLNNERLIEMEEISQKVYDKMTDDIQKAHEIAKLMKEEAEDLAQKKQGQPITKRRANEK